MYYEFYTDEMIAEYKKALEIAEQYKMNSDRIKRLLSFEPVTVESGKRLVSCDNQISLICMIGETYPIGYYINPALVA